MSVLIVDDRESNRDIFSEMLRTAGFTVFTAGNSAECLSMLHKTAPDCILLDILMPGTNGIETTRILQNLPEREQFKIIGLSASALPEDRDSILDAGADGFLCKPCSRRELLETIGRVTGVRYSFTSENTVPVPPRPTGTEIPDSDKLRELLEAARFGSRKKILESTEKGFPHELAASIRVLAGEYRFKEIIRIIEDLN